MNKKQTLAITITGLLCALLAGCGGGSDDSSDNPSPPTSTRADFGAWQAVTSNGTYTLTIGNTGELWGYQINSDASTMFLFHGQESINGARVAGSYMSYNLLAIGAPTSLSYTGTAQANSYLNLTFNNGGILNYSYFPVVAQTGTLSNFQGAWVGRAYNNLPGNTFFASTMAVSGSNVSLPTAGPSGCQLTGTIAPQSAFIGDVANYSFSGQFSAQCGVQGGVQVGGASVIGLLSYDPPSATGGTQNQLLLFAVTADQQTGMMFVGNQ